MCKYALKADCHPKEERRQWSLVHGQLTKSLRLALAMASLLACLPFQCGLTSMEDEDGAPGFHGMGCKEGYNAMDDTV